MNFLSIPIFKEIFGTISNTINTLSFLITLATFIVTIRFRRKLRAEFDKKSLNKNGEKLSRKISGYAESLSKDHIYDDEFIRNISIELRNILNEYSCMSFSLKHYIKYTVYYIEKICLETDMAQRAEIAHKLCVWLNKIAILLKKEI